MFRHHDSPPAHVKYLTMAYKPEFSYWEAPPIACDVRHREVISQNYGPSLGTLKILEAALQNEAPS